MRTAQEMYDYSLKNDFGEGIGKWGLRSFTVIERLLQPGEEALICFIGLHDYRGATSNKGNYAYAITNKRLLLAQKKLIGEVSQIINLENLNDITSKIGAVWGFITFDTLKERFTACFASSQAKKLAPVLTAFFSEFQQKHESSSAEISLASPADELRKFKQLLDEGIINQEEFEAKKKQILGL